MPNNTYSFVRAKLAPIKINPSQMLYALLFVMGRLQTVAGANYYFNQTDSRYLYNQMLMFAGFEEVDKQLAAGKCGQISPYGASSVCDYQTVWKANKTDVMGFKTVIAELSRCVGDAEQKKFEDCLYQLAEAATNGLSRDSRTIMAGVGAAIGFLLLSYCLFILKKSYSSKSSIAKNIEEDKEQPSSILQAEAVRGQGEENTHLLKEIASSSAANLDAEDEVPSRPLLLVKK